MTPLTHAAVGTAICRELRKLNWGPWAWVLALILAVASHYLLDAIPHFEGVMPILNYKANPLLSLGMGIVGVALALILLRWNRHLGRTWLVLFLWIGLGGYAFSWLRLVTAGLALLYMAWKDADRSATWYTAAGMLAVAPDLVPNSFRHLTRVHHYFHYTLDWASRLHLQFARSSLPESMAGRLHDPYFLLGYALELLVEGMVFLGATWLFFRQEKLEKSSEGEDEGARELEFSEKS